MTIRSFDGVTALVTGAGSGIGLAIAGRLACRRCRLALVDVRMDRLSAAKRRLAPLSPAVTVYRADVGDEEAVARLRDRVTVDHARVSILVNSAGVSLAGSFLECTPDDLEWVMRVNFWGTVHCCRAFLPDMLRNGGGQIVNIGSCFGWVGYPGKSVYCASKFAVRGFSESLRAELRGTSVGVTVVYPGPVDTNLIWDGLAVDDRQRADEVAFLAGRAIRPDRVAEKAVEAIERNTARVLVGRDYRLIDLAVRLAPSWTLGVLSRLGGLRRFGGSPAGAARDREHPGA